MDPDSNLAEQLRLVDRVFKGHGLTSDEVSRLAELVESLAEWLERGGALPRVWHLAQANRAMGNGPPQHPPRAAALIRDAAIAQETIDPDELEAYADAQRSEGGS